MRCDNERAMKNRTRFSAFSLVILTAILSACGEQSPPKVATSPRPVVVMTIEPLERKEHRVVGGVVRATERADLAFRAGGRILDLNVEIGTEVVKGQVLARLDTTIIELRSKQSRATVERLEATVAERQRRLGVQSKLHASGYSTLQSLRGAELEVATGQAELRDAQAGLALAERDLSDAVLIAPHNGIVAAREVEPNTEIAAGQVVLRVDGSGGLEISANLPSAIVGRIIPGQPITAEFASIGKKMNGRILRIGGRGETGLTFPVVAALESEARAAGVRPGMVADLAIETSAMSGIVVPMTAIVAGGTPTTGTVFVVEPGSGLARRRQVVVSTLTDDGVRIAEGLAAGETIVAVGAAFIQDGSQVQPLNAK